MKSGNIFFNTNVKDIFTKKGHGKMETIKINKLLTDEEILEKQKEFDKQGKVVICVSRVEADNVTEFKVM